MKRFYFISILAAFLATGACTTENKKYHAENFVEPSITQPTAGSKITLTEDTQTDSLFIGWEPAEYGFPAALTYTVEIAKPDTYFEDGIKIGETKKNYLLVDHATLNNSALIAGLVPETPSPVELRVMASINNHIQKLTSLPIIVTLTPYNKTVTYPVLYVPGSYQGWNPGNPETTVTSPKANNIYEGYFYFPANTEFKFTAQPDWDPLNWGYGGEGKLSPGAGNIKVEKAGFYQVIANISNLTYSVIPVTWEIQGTATNNTSIPLSYNETDKTLEVTTPLSAGEFVFREKGAGNRVLGVYFGTQLMDNGSEIIVSSDGTYTIHLNLGHYPYTFSLE